MYNKQFLKFIQIDQINTYEQIIQFRSGFYIPQNNQIQFDFNENFDFYYVEDKTKLYLKISIFEKKYGKKAKISQRIYYLNDYLILDQLQEIEVKFEKTSGKDQNSSIKLQLQVQSEINLPKQLQQTVEQKKLFISRKTINDYFIQILGTNSFTTVENILQNMRSAFQSQDFDQEIISDLYYYLLEIVQFFKGYTDIINQCLLIVIDISFRNKINGLKVEQQIFQFMPFLKSHSNMIWSQEIVYTLREVRNPSQCVTFPTDFIQQLQLNFQTTSTQQSMNPRKSIKQMLSMTRQILEIVLENQETQKQKDEIQKDSQQQDQLQLLQQLIHQEFNSDDPSKQEICLDPSKSQNLQFPQNYKISMEIKTNDQQRQSELESVLELVEQIVYVCEFIGHQDEKLVWGLVQPFMALKLEKTYLSAKIYSLIAKYVKWALSQNTTQNQKDNLVPSASYIIAYNCYFMQNSEILLISLNYILNELKNQLERKDHKFNEILMIIYQKIEQIYSIQKLRPLILQTIHQDFKILNYLEHILIEIESDLNTFSTSINILIFMVERLLIFDNQIQSLKTKLEKKFKDFPFQEKKEILINLNKIMEQKQMNREVIEKAKQVKLKNMKSINGLRQRYQISKLSWM